MNEVGKEVVATYFKVIFKHFPGDIRRIINIPCICHLHTFIVHRTTIH